MTQDADGARVGGLTIKKWTSTQGKKEEDQGTIQIVLEANKDEINSGAYSFGQILTALSTHQEGKHPVVLRVLMNTDADPA